MRRYWRWFSLGTIGIAALWFAVARVEWRPDATRDAGADATHISATTEVPPAPGNRTAPGQPAPSLPADTRLPAQTAASPVPAGYSLPVDPYVHAQVLQTKDRVSSAGPLTLERTRLLRTDFKYPLLRVQETIRRNPQSNSETVLARVAMAADHILVKLRPGVALQDLEETTRRLGGQVRRAMAMPGLYLVSFAPATLDTVPEQVAAYRAQAAGVEYAEPDYIVHALASSPNDPDLSLLWGLHNTGQTGGTPGADINAFGAWTYETGNTNVVIAVLDSGIDYNHIDLAANVWANPFEVANGIDDDGNGYVDDVRGWNYVVGTADPMDDNSHGSHVSGTIAAVGNNGVGVVGVNWRAQIMPLKFLDSGGHGAISDAVEALQYVLQMRRHGVNVRVTSNSWGGGGFSIALTNAIAQCGEEGILFVAAAGNDADDADITPHYPASYPLANIIAVAATDASDNLAYFSTYGHNSVHLAAPGVSIRSTIPGGNYGSMQGTSMATPHVAGVAALAFAAVPQASAADVKNAIMAGVDPVASLSGKTVTGGRLNALRTLASLAPVIVHTPLDYTSVTNVPYPVDATITPSSLLNTNALWLFWNTTGSTNLFTSNLLVRVTNSLYHAEIPAQPMGAQVSYWLQAATISNRVTRCPSNAPTGMIQFRVTPALALIVEGYPDNYGTVSPDYGWATHPSGMVIRASAVQSTTPANGHRYFCAGWTGMGSVPLTGPSNQVAFTLARNSGISWQWVDQYSLTQTSTVAGIVSTTTWWTVGSTAQTVKADSPVTLYAASYSFAGWEIGGVRQPDATNRAANPASFVMSTSPVVAAAVYLPSGRDDDLDGLPDWWELFWFGSLSPLPDDDPDNDGYRNLEECQDSSDPRDPASTPQPPVISHTPLADPQTAPAPWTVAAVVTDNTAVAGVDLCWKKNTQPTWRRVSMTNMGASLYVGIIPAPGILGDTFYYRIEATDAAGYLTSGDSNRFFVAYPITLTTPTNFDVILKPGQYTNLTLSVTNWGNTNFTWTVLGHEVTFRADMESDTNAWTHDGPLDLWHLTTLRSFSPTHSWYCGVDSTRRYLDSTHGSLIMPPRTIGSGAILQFDQWLSSELNEDIPGQAWDGGVIEVSTNHGASYDPIAPVGGYPYTITENPDSPFAANTPCLAGTGGWQTVAVDLSAYSGRDLTIRFRFGADALVVEEGWYIDDVRLIEPLKTNGWFSISPTGGVVAVSAGTNLTLSLSAAALPSGVDVAAFVEMIGNDPFIATNRIPVALRVRSEPIGTLDFAAQTSTNGEGFVTVTQTVADADGESCSISLEYSVDGGGSWTNARVLSATSTPAGIQFTNAGPFQLLGALTRTNGIPVTNNVRVVWDTRNSPLPVTLCVDTRLRARIWDGIFWDVSDITSAPFLVDNEAPSLPTGLTSTSHVIQTWSANPLLHVSWAPSSDGSGIGVAGYLCGMTTNLPLVLFTQFSGQTQTVLSAAGESTNWWVCVKARDAFGNTGGVAAIGPFWIDTLPPSAGGALVSVLRSPAGNYIVGDGTVTSLWSGFTDRGIGVAGYYYGFTNSAGTTNGIWTAGTTAVLTGAQLDRTNTVFVWAQDQLGWIGSATAATVLVLRAESDWDRDGLSNGAEETAGTDAADPQSVFRADSISAGTNASGFVIRWNSIAGRRYALYSTNIVVGTNPWAPVATDLTGIGGTMEYTDTNAVAPTLYYRITVRLP